MHKHETHPASEALMALPESFPANNTLVPDQTTAFTVQRVYVTAITRTYYVFGSTRVALRVEGESDPAKRGMMSDLEYHLVKAQKHHVGAFRLKDVWLHPNAHDSVIRVPSKTGSVTGERLVTVPYGSLEAYAQQLAREWGSDEEYVMVYISFGHHTDLPSADDLSRANETLLNAMTPEQRQRLRRLDEYRPEDILSKEDLPPEYKEKLNQIPTEERRKVKYMKNPDGTISVIRVAF